MNLSKMLFKHAIKRHILVLNKIKDLGNDVPFYTLADEIYFGDSNSNNGLNMILDDLDVCGFVESKPNGFHDHYSITDNCNKLLEKLEIV